MSLQADYKFALAAQQTLDTITGAAASRIDYSQFEVSGRLNATSTPPVTKAAYLTLTGTGVDSGVIDFTALAGPLGSTIDCTGLKLQGFRATNKATSDGYITFVQGALTPYVILDMQVYPGETLMHLFNDRLEDVAAGVKRIDWDCSDDCEVELTLLFG
jgi:hypothetical protein